MPEDETAETPRIEWPKDRAKLPTELWVVVDGAIATDAKWSAHTYATEKDALERVAKDWLRCQAWKLELREWAPNSPIYVTTKLEYVNPVAAKFQPTESDQEPPRPVAREHYDAFTPQDPPEHDETDQMY